MSETECKDTYFPRNSKEKNEKLFKFISFLTISRLFCHEHFAKKPPLNCDNMNLTLIPSIFHKSIIYDKRSQIIGISQMSITSTSEKIHSICEIYVRKWYKRKDTETQSFFVYSVSSVSWKKITTDFRDLTDVNHERKR